MKKHALLSLLFCITVGFAFGQDSKRTLLPTDPLDFSENLFLAIRTEQPYAAYVDTLEQMDLDRLAKALNTQDKKLAFWINTYNSLVQIKARKNKAAFANLDTFFKKSDILFGGTYISLDVVENGIMRKKPQSKHQVFTSKFAVKTLDARIHFTLNCGATSCPPIAYYDYTELQEQLATAEKFFITSNSRYDAAKNQLEISELFKWFESDFGGRSSVIQLMKKYRICPSDAKPSIQYSPYDWHLDLDNY